MQSNNINNFLKPIHSKKYSPLKIPNSFITLPSVSQNPSQRTIYFDTDRTKSPSFSTQTFQRQQQSPFKKLESKFKDLEKQYESISLISENEHKLISRRSLTPRVSQKQRQLQRSKEKQRQNINQQQKRIPQQQHILKRTISNMLTKVKTQLQNITQQIHQFQNKIQSYINIQFNTIKQTIKQYIDLILDNNKQQFKKEYQKKIIELNKPMYVIQHKLSVIEKRIGKVKESSERRDWQRQGEMSVQKISGEVEQIIKKAKEMVMRKFVVEIQKDILKSIQKSLKDVLKIEGRGGRSIFK